MRTDTTVVSRIFAVITKHSNKGDVVVDRNLVKLAGEDAAVHDRFYHEAIEHFKCQYRDREREKAASDNPDVKHDLPGSDGLGAGGKDPAAKYRAPFLGVTVHYLGDGIRYNIATKASLRLAIAKRNDTVFEYEKWNRFDGKCIAYLTAHGKKVLSALPTKVLVNLQKQYNETVNGGKKKD